MYFFFQVMYIIFCSTLVDLYACIFTHIQDDFIPQFNFSGEYLYKTCFTLCVNECKEITCFHVMNQDNVFLIYVG
jgi:hypothetical protein